MKKRLVKSLFKIYWSKRKLFNYNSKTNKEMMNF